MIYLDNAATSFPKAPGVGARMQYYIENVGVNVNRGVYGPAQEAGLEVLALREKLCILFRHPNPTHVILTGGATEALNLAIRGALRPGDHVLVSAMEHNAVMRPLVQLGVVFDRVPCDGFGRMDLTAMETLLRPDTRMMILCHVSNVCGTVQDLAGVKEICRRRGIPLVLDAAQSAGHLPVEFEGLSALAVPAHKGLLGPQGVGALLLAPEFAEGLLPILAGGTGSASDSEAVPPWLPDRFEAGTPNLPGIYGWSAALDHLLDGTMAAAMARERELTARFLEGIRAMTGLRLVGLPTAEGRTGVIALDFLHRDNAEAADILARRYGILTRCGLHCAPAAHKTLGTFPRGAVRCSLGPGSGAEEIDCTLAALASL